MLQAAIEAERDAFLAEFAERRTTDGRSAVVGSGYHPERAVQTGIGPVTVKVPKVRAKDGKPVTFRSALVPPYVRKAKSIEVALPWLYLKGISTGEMGAALKMLLGPEATGFSAKTISRLKSQWAAEYDDWRKADLSRDEWVYVWADGIYSVLRGSDDRLCVLVVIGPRATPKCTSENGSVMSVLPCGRARRWRESCKRRFAYASRLPSPDPR